MGFFDTKQGAAEFKHAVLERYVPVFAQKLGRYSAGHQVHLLDGYAGQGWYGDDSPGSPVLLLGTARSLSKHRNITCWFVEEDASNYRLLTSNLEDASLRDRVHAFHGTMEERMAEITAQIGSAPLFGLVDPFGIGLPFDSLVDGLLRRRAKTEVLVSFIHAGIYRNAGRLTQRTNSPMQHKVATKVLRRLDSNLGGPWWHYIWLGSTPERGRVDAIRNLYVEKVLEAAGSGWRCYQVPVADSLGAVPIYDMLLFTKNPEGSWCFNDAVSLAREAVEGHAVLKKGTANQPSLWDVADDWVSQIVANLAALLPPGGRPVRVVDHIQEVYGTSLTFARSRHVREAAERLFQQGMIVNPMKGIPVEKLRLYPKAAVQTA